MSSRGRESNATRREEVAMVGPWRVALLAASVLGLSGWVAFPTGGGPPSGAAHPSSQCSATDAGSQPTGPRSEVPDSTPRSYESSFPLCRDLKAPTAPAKYYRDTPIYVGNSPDNEVREWA